jgi:sulfonate transport system ATP-binding protein
MTSPQSLKKTSTYMTVRIDRKQFGGVLLFADFELEIQAGETLVVLGPSGSGKTTLLRLISGLDSEYLGEIRSHDPSSQHIPPGYVFQDVRLFPWMTVNQNLQFASSNGRISHERMAELLAEVGLSESTAVLYPRQLSGGMGKRAALARALAGEPRLLLLDEPFSELDAKSKFAMYESLLRCKSLQAAPLTIMLVTHDIDEAVYLGDRIVVLGEGRPATLVKEVRVSMPRPRARSDSSYVELCTMLIRTIVSDVDRELRND